MVVLAGHGGVLGVRSVRGCGVGGVRASAWRRRPVGWQRSGTAGAMGESGSHGGGDVGGGAVAWAFDDVLGGVEHLPSRLGGVEQPTGGELAQRACGGEDGGVVSAAPGVADAGELGPDRGGDVGGSVAHCPGRAVRGRCGRGDEPIGDPVGQGDRIAVVDQGVTAGGQNASRCEDLSAPAAGVQEWAEQPTAVPEGLVGGSTEVQVRSAGRGEHLPCGGQAAVLDGQCLQSLAAVHPARPLAGLGQVAVHDQQPGRSAGDPGVVGGVGGEEAGQPAGVGGGALLPLPDGGDLRPGPDGEEMPAPPGQVQPCLQSRPGGAVAAHRAPPSGSGGTIGSGIVGGSAGSGSTTWENTRRPSQRRSDDL